MDEEEASVSLFRTQLPISKVKKICKLDPDSTLVSSEAAQLITMATERFVGLLAKAAHGQAALSKRRTIQYRDIENAIRGHRVFEFLDGTLDGWPETHSTKRKDQSTVSEEHKENLPESQNNLDADDQIQDKGSPMVGESAEMDASDSPEVQIVADANAEK